MGKLTLEQILDPKYTYNVRYNELVAFLEQDGWKSRQKGSHLIMTKAGCPFLINIQPEKDGKAKAYQVQQVRKIYLQ
jgi:predicted RNA binding protein YcfA (HicA-like mRNA interferase family)